jgi:hypothetical protein
MGLSGANLRSLHVHKMCCSFVRDDYPSPHLSSGCLSSLIRLLVKGCPRLESLCLAHGSKYISRGEALPPLPRLGAAFADGILPTTLVMLHRTPSLTLTHPATPHTLARSATRATAHPP